MPRPRSLCMFCGRTGQVSIVVQNRATQHYLGKICVAHTLVEIISDELMRFKLTIEADEYALGMIPHVEPEK